MAEAVNTERAQLAGAAEGHNVIRDGRPNGEIVIAPDTSWGSIAERGGGREATPEEWEEFMRECGPQMLPPDGEG